MKKQLLILSFVLSNICSAADYMIVMGAGGEEAKPDTIFDGAIRNLANYVRNNPSVNVDVALNGGHSSTEAIIRDEFPSNVPKSGFLENDYKRIIEKYTNMLKNDQIKSGDQLMIYVDSHGAEKEDGYKTHRISTAGAAARNLNTLEGSSLVDLDQLEIIRNLAKEKNVKLAIIDGSCHSGNTLKLADENTCVISSSGPNHYGYTSFSNNFTNAMAKGKTLEEIFLDSRSKESAPSFPMISTDEGQAVNQGLYEKLTPFLYEYDSKNDKLTPYLLNNNNEAQMCLSNANYQSLIASIDRIEEMNTVTRQILWWTVKTKEVDFSELKRLLAEYKKTLDEAALKMREMRAGRLKNIERIKVEASTESFRSHYESDVSWSDLLTSDYDQLITSVTARISMETKALEKTSLLANLDFYTKARARKQEILRNNPDLSTIKQRQEELMRSIQSGRYITSSIATEERKLYEAMYKMARKDKQDKQSNPCNNFRL